MIQTLWEQLAGRSGLLRGRVYQNLWLEAVLAATTASALMAVVAGVVVLNQSARQLRHEADEAQRQLSASLTSYAPLYTLQRQVQEAASGQMVESAVVVDQRGVVLAASNSALVGLPLSHVLQLPTQRLLRQLFDECPSASSLLSCLSRDELVFHGSLPWIGGEAVLAMHPYPLALEGLGRYGDRATLITVSNGRFAAREALSFILTVFLAGLLPLMAGCVGLMLRLRQRLIPELLRLAQVDALSGVYNRRAFMETAEELLRRSEQAQLRMALALIDVDHFKQVNDTYGHDAGDQVIRLVSELLRSSLRSVDLVGRHGGDEFMILVQLPADQATAMLERILAQVRSTDMQISSDAPVMVTLSIGVAASDGPSRYQLAQLMTAADAAL
ncbi:MAG: diguanylate cyclase, partial [Vulcanococcus sp.]